MSQVTVGENEGIESALRRFKRSVAKAGIFSDLRRIRHHETPVEKYKRKLKQRSRNRRRWARTTRQLQTGPRARFFVPIRRPLHGALFTVRSGFRQTS
jgi:small subunit ribosomal protein S21